ATILMIVSLVQVSAKGFSQISIHKRNASLADVFKSIEAQTDYVFFSKDYDLEENSIDINVSDVSLETALGICFRNLPLTYKIIDKTVVIRRTSSSPAPTEIAESAIDIRGRVTGADGAPLTGVSIRLAGTTTGTTSNENGQYILTVPDGTGMLIFSYVGYVTQEIAIDNRS